MQAEPKKRHLFVVIGAGASYDCISDDVEMNRYMPINNQFQPPLVMQLFEGRFAEILGRYPLLEQVTPAIRTKIRCGAVALEDYLEDELRHSRYAHLRRAYWAIPLYLQHVMLQVSLHYTRHPDNYDSLITEALKLDRVTFITLNYDTILDGRLAALAGSTPDSMDWYVHPERVGFRNSVGPSDSADLQRDRVNESDAVALRVRRSARARRAEPPLPSFDQSGTRARA